MTQPTPPTVVIADIARETTQLGIQQAITALQAALTELSGKVDALMSQDSTIGAEVAAEETDITALTASVSSMQALLVALQGEQGLSQATLDAAAKVKSDLDALAATAAADVAMDTPPAPPITGA